MPTTNYEWPTIAESQSQKFQTHNDALELIDAKVKEVEDAVGGGSGFATETYVNNAIADIVDAAPGALNTLNELAAALGDDANYATTITTALAAKAPLASPALTGTPTAPTATGGTNTTQIATTAFVTAAVTAGSGATNLDGLSDVAVSSPATGQILRYNGTNFVNEVVPYDIALYIAGAPTASEVVMRFVAPRAFSLASGASGRADAGTAATGSPSFALAKNGGGIGTITWSGGTTGTVSITSTTAFAAGDVLTITAPGTADATLANIAITLAATRS